MSRRAVEAAAELAVVRWRAEGERAVVRAEDVVGQAAPGRAVELGVRWGGGR